MKLNLNIDLRRSDPLGSDVRVAYLAMRENYRAAARMGVADRYLPGALEHERERRRQISEGRNIHNLLVVIAKFIGKEAWEKIPQLKWAMEHNIGGAPVHSEDTEL